ncbi:MAG TPA: potassium-transporting ATPase subunit KdpA [Ilumatobacteraceae bacterium]|nr:potassium-transporting ATPase subunit KdpA [Ilumatobacteraceae bacterium]
MGGAGLFQTVALLVVVALTAPPLGRYMAAVYGSRADGSAPGDRVFAPIERRIYRALRVDEKREQRWNIYAIALLAFSLVSFLVVYVIQRVQGSLPFNPTDRAAVAPLGAFNVAVSFMTNTNWQWYGGEGTMSHLTQMVGLTVQNFVSAAAGMAVVVAIIRGIVRRGQRTLGNFWVDLTRTTLRVLLPLSFVIAVLLSLGGVVQNLNGYTDATPVDAAVAAEVTQSIPGGPVASQIAIKQLGTNGGGFYNVNSAHPFENGTGLTNFVETWAIVVVPIALVVTYGVLIGSKKQARVLLAVMVGIWIAMSVFAMVAEQSGNPNLTMLGVDQGSSTELVGGNLEGKEVRFGPASCGLWAASTTGTSNGSVNCMHDSFTPIGGMFPMVHMMLGEVSPGGVGVGLMGILVYALLAVFIAGLMVGRTPEYLGKKIQAAEMKLVVLYLVAMPLALLGFAAASVVIDSASSTILNPGAHGLSEVLYNYSSAANNNGSAFAGQGTGTDWYTITQGLAMLMGRFFLIIPALAIGGSLVRKQRVPATAGTFPTDSPLYGALVAGAIVIVAGLTFFPALALGPIVEQLSL